MKETKHDKWKRLSESRRQKINEQLRLITNLNNKANYEYTEEEADELFDKIEKSVQQARSWYHNSRKFFLE